MPFVLAEPPGFTDLPDANLNAGSGATGFVFSALKDNAAFGSVVPEVFYTAQNNGSTVPLPISPADGYQYQRNELIYMWEIMSTVSGESGIPSASVSDVKLGGAGLLWCEWYVEPNTGVVHSTEVYGHNSLSNWTTTHDGTLGVWAIGIRGRQLRTLASQPAYTDLAASNFNEDNAATQPILQQVSRNAKRGSVQCEVIPMNPSNAPKWQPSTFYAAGAIVQPTGFQASGFWFIAANSGTSAALEPVWPGVWHLSSPVIDGSIVWNVAGAGFYNGQQIPFPVSPVDGYAYSASDTVVPFLSFISTQAMPFQKKQGVLFTSGNGMLELKKSVTSTQPSNPGQGGKGGNPPGNPLAGTNVVWDGTLQNWTVVINPPAAPALTQAAGGSLGARTYFIKITYVSPAGETTASAESSLAVSANNLASVTSPGASGAATAYKVYASTSTGTEVLQTSAPVPIGTNWTEDTTGLDTGTASPPSVNTTGFIPSPAETSMPAFLTPGSGTTGVGIVNCSVDYFNSGFFADGTCMVWCICFRNIAAMAAPGGAVFTDMSTDWFSTGFPLRSDYMQDLNENTKFSILRPEVFLNANVTPGTAVPTPVSPVDGYAYARSEMDYLWYFTWTGHNAGLLRDFTIFVDPISGILNTRYDSYRTNGLGTLATAIYGNGGLLTYQNMGGSGRGTPQVNVIVLARRQHVNELQTPIIVTSGGTPAPPGPANLIPNGNFDIWPIPSPNAVNVGVADDWGVLQNSGRTYFLQVPGLGNSLFGQGIGALPSATTLAGRQTIPPPNGNHIASVASMIIPVWAGGTYRFHFIAAAQAQFGGSGPINFGFYARVHCLAASATGEPDLTTDTSFELVGSPLTSQPGTSSANNPGGAITTAPPAVTSFDFTFTTPLASATFAQTSQGKSVLSQTMPSNTAYLYVEFLCWDLVSNGTGHLRFAEIDNVVLQDLTAGSTNLNQQGSMPTSGADNSAFSFSTTTTSIALWWVAFNLPQANGVSLAVPAQGSSGSPAVTFSGLSPSTTYFVSARYNLATFTVELRADTTKLVYPLTTTWLNADGFFPIFANFQISTPAAGTGGGGGNPGGGGCFTGEVKIKTVGGRFVAFQELPPVVLIENERGRFLADHIVHEDMTEDVIPLGGGAVTVGHNIEWGGEYKRADQIFSSVKPLRHHGKLHNLHVRTDDPEAQHYIVEGGYKAHNLFKN